MTRVSGTFPSPQDSRFRVPTCSISHLVFHSYTINVSSVDSIVATTISAVAKLPASKELATEILKLRSDLLSELGVAIIRCEYIRQLIIESSELIN